ncbi:MAG: hypothetical protein QXD23_03270 [Candidatus Micrarchaeaceae archaeon]
MNFLTDNSPVTSGYTGYAPQLYCTTSCEQSSYAQFDNGANVFNFYDNFINSNGWSLTGGNTIIDNGVSLYSAPVTNIASSTYETTLTNTIVEEAWNDVTPISRMDPFEYGNSNGGGHIGIYVQSSTIYGQVYTTNGWQDVIMGHTTSQTGLIILGIWEYGSSSYWENNYNTFSYPSLPYGGSGNNININDNTFNTVSGQTDFIQYVRVRSAPPNGVMPSESIS